MKRHEEIIEALNQLGGVGNLKEIYDKVTTITTKRIPNTFEACIRAAIERNSSDSKLYTGKRDIFYSAKSIGEGVWGLREPTISDSNMDITQDDENFAEGKKYIKKHIVRERNHALIEKAKEKFKKKHNGKLYCEICKFDFGKVYGEQGDGFIEVHHTKRVADMKPGEKTNINDLMMVCSNCHSMIHRYKPYLSKSKARSMLKKKIKIV